MTRIAKRDQITVRQILRTVKVFFSKMYQDRDLITSRNVQLALLSQSLGAVLFAAFREYVKLASDVIIVRVRLENRDRTQQEAIEATGCVLSIDPSVVMPKASDDEVEIIFFRPGRFLYDDDLEKEYGIRGLEPVNPFLLAAANEADPYFVQRDGENATHWKDAWGNWCCLSFDFWGIDKKERRVFVFRDGQWRGDVWFAGVPVPIRVGMLDRIVREFFSIVKKTTKVV